MLQSFYHPKRLKKLLVQCHCLTFKTHLDLDTPKIPAEFWMLKSILFKSSSVYDWKNVFFSSQRCDEKEFGLTKTNTWNKTARKRRHICLQKMWVKVQPWLMVNRKFIYRLRMLHFTSGFQAGRLKEILTKALKRPKKTQKSFQLVRHSWQSLIIDLFHQVFTSPAASFSTGVTSHDDWKSTFVCLHLALFWKHIKQKTLSF